EPGREAGVEDHDEEEQHPFPFAHRAVPPRAPAGRPKPATLPRPRAAARGTTRKRSWVQPSVGWRRGRAAGGMARPQADGDRGGCSARRRGDERVLSASVPTCQRPAPAPATDPTALRRGCRDEVGRECRLSPLAWYAIAQTPFGHRRRALPIVNIAIMA